MMLYAILELKFYLSFSNSQFKINSYKDFRHDRNRQGGGLLSYVNEEIPCKIINQQTYAVFSD